MQVTGGSLEESKEALAIAETDGMCIYSGYKFFPQYFNCSLLSLVLIAYDILFSWQLGFSVQLVCTQLDAMWVSVASKTFFSFAENHIRFSVQNSFFNVEKFVTLVFLVYSSRNLMRVVIQKIIFRSFCHWLKKGLRKGRCVVCYLGKLSALGYDGL